MSPMGENGLFPLEGESESPSPVKPIAYRILAFSFVSVLRIPFSLSDTIPNASSLRDSTNDHFLSLLCLPVLK